MKTPEDRYLERGVLFWKEAVATKSLPSDAYFGFGWWAEVTALDRDRWEDLILLTCDRADGTLDWCVAVAQRCAQDPITDSHAETLSMLLRGRHDPWDRSQIAEIAMAVLERVSDEEELHEGARKLRSALTDLGYLGAADM